MKLYNTNSTRTNPIRLLTLGYGGSYFAAWNDGKFAYDLVGCSKVLDEMLDRLLEAESSGSRSHGVTEIEVRVCRLRAKTTSPDREFHNQYISISPFHPNRWILFFKDGTYFCSLPSTWHVLCAPISATNSAFMKKQYPDAEPLPSSTRREIVSQLIQFVTEHILTAILTSPSTVPATTGDPNASSTGYVPETGASESMFYSNVTDTGDLDFGMGESVVAAHGLAGVTDVGASATSASNPDGGSGVAHFSGGDDGGGGGVAYTGGDGGGGGAIGGFGF